MANRKLKLGNKNWCGRKKVETIYRQFTIRTTELSSPEDGHFCYNQIVCDSACTGLTFCTRARWPTVEFRILQNIRNFPGGLGITKEPACGVLHCNHISA